MQRLLCEACDRKLTPEFTREPGWSHRIVRGVALQATQAQRTIEVHGSDPQTIKMDTSHYNCDSCNAEIRHGDRATALTLWPPWRHEPAAWEGQYLEPCEMSKGVDYGTTKS